MRTRFPFIAAIALFLIPRASVFADETAGQTIYRAACVRCHGPNGEGTKDYNKPLVGGRSIGQLSKLIQRTMPEDDPGTLSAEDSAKVAEYIHGAFYSDLARERNRPARLELSRLTVNQYRNIATDLVGSFRGQSNWDPKQPGLKAEYFKNRQFRKNDRVIDRVDPTVQFDFGVTAPSDKIEPHEFSIRWEGSLLAPETGEYEFIVKTEHATRLYLNDNNKPLIDAWVKSGNDTEYKASIFLLGGRAYPLRLDFSKAKQGVDDSKKTKEKPKPVQASIAFEWKLPDRPAEVVPSRNLSTSRTPALFVLSTPFPPDDRSVGFVRGTSVSKAWDQATTEAAIEVANYVGNNLNAIAGTNEGAADRTEKLKGFVTRFVERAFRHPIQDDERKLYVDHPFASTKTPELAVRRAILFTLKSPRFLYVDPDATSPHEVATRIALTLWDSLPDQELIKAAAQGKLKTVAEVKTQSERMVGDLRTRAKIRLFLLDWLRVEKVPDISKDAKAYPGFDTKLASDLRTSLDLFLEDVVWGETSDYRRLLNDDSIYLNGRLAKFYGATLPADAAFQKVKLDAADRAGILSHPYLMSTFAYSETSSPIHRGVFLSRSVLGRALKQPPVAVAPVAPDLHPGLTTRERVELQTKPTMCNTCHGMINPLGFGLEHFDAVGRYRKEEKGKPIDAKGSYENVAGEALPYDGARGLAKLLLASEEPTQAFVKQLFHTLVKQPIRAYGPAEAELHRSFVSNGYQIRKLATEIAIRSALPSGPEPTKIVDAKKP